MPLTLTTLAALVPPELNAQVELFDEGVHDISPDIQADLIGISGHHGNGAALLRTGRPLPQAQHSCGARRRAPDSCS
jgi:hypothetical protein